MEGRQAPLKHGQMTVGLLLVVLGIGFLLLQWVDTDLVASWWPAFIVVPGLALLISGLASGERGAALAIPGSILTTLGAILAIQNATGLWETWAYVWPLVGPGATGAGLWIFGTRARKPQVALVGSRMAMISAVVAAVLGVFFEIVVGISGTASPWLSRIVWPLVLIALGIWLLIPKGRR